MDVGSPLQNLDLRLEVLVPRLNRDAVLEADGRNLDWVIVVEAGRFCVQGVEVLLVEFLHPLLPRFGVLPLSHFLLLAHCPKVEALLLAGIVSCLRLPLQLLALWR